MNLRQLEAFKATIKSGSITGAGELMHISQPSVSRLISDLEDSVGFPLFVRAGRRVVATVEARRFYRSVESMFIGIDRLKELADSIRTTAGGVVSLGVIPSLTHVHMPEAVRDLYQSRPEVRIMVQTRNTPSIIDAVQMQQYDLGIIGRSSPDGVEVLYQTAVPYVCLVPESHALAKSKEDIDLDLIADSENFATYIGAYQDAMQNLDQALVDRLSANSRLSFANMPVAASLARVTGAFAIVDPFTAQIAEKLGGVVGRPIKQDLKYSIAIITKGQDTLSLEARELADVLIKKFDDNAS